jgi:hypothetical protein
VTLGAKDCRHENLRRAIVARGAGSRSVNMPVCVTAPGGPACGVHVVTTRANGVNTDPARPRDYQAAILTWVRARLGDPSSRAAIRWSPTRGRSSVGRAPALQAGGRGFESHRLH